MAPPLFVAWTVLWALLTPRHVGIAFEGEPTKLALANLALVVGWLLGGYLIFRITRPSA